MLFMRVTSMAMCKSVYFLAFSIALLTNSHIIASDVQNMYTIFEISSGPYVNQRDSTNSITLPIKKAQSITNEHERKVIKSTISEEEVFSATNGNIARTIIDKVNEKPGVNMVTSENDQTGQIEFFAIDYDNGETNPCNKSHSIIINNYTLFDNGSLLDLNKNLLYPPEYFWKDVDKRNNTVVRGCICLLKNCVRKCCPEGMTFLGNDNDCAPSNISLLHPFQLKYIDEDTYELINDSDSDVHLIYGKPCTGEAYVLSPSPDYPEDMYYLLNTGVLSVPAKNKNHSLDDFCMEALEVAEDLSEILPLVCITEDDELTDPEPAEKNEMTLLNPVGMIISLPFLLLTFLVYAVLSELKNLHGLSLMSYVGCLFIAYTFLAIVQIGGRALSKRFCISCAFVIFFAFHASFFWLNVMCFDIWWTFSGLRPLRGSVKEREYKKFVMYSIYAWGSPLIMLIVCLLMDLVPGIPDEYIKPKFGETKCWFSTTAGDLAYFFGPIGIIVLCNIVLFIATAIKLIQLKKETKMLKGEESKRHDEESERQRFNLYLKLFIVMGVNWIMELISWAVGGPEYLWYITDLGNTLQGVLIFVIFVWKRKIRRLLSKKFCPKLARTSIYEGSVKSRQTASRTSSINNTYRTSISTQDHLVMKPLPNGAYRFSEVP